MTDVLDPASPRALLRRVKALEDRFRALAVVLAGGQYAADIGGARDINTTGVFQTYMGAPSVVVVVPTSGRLLVSWGFRGYNNQTTASTVRLAPAMSGANTVTPSPGDSGGATVVIGSTTATTPIPADMTRLFEGLAPGTTTVALQAYISSGTSATNKINDSWLRVEPLP
ncbi:hypothetical protein ACQP1V_36205 [Microtetraspora malaysiensis]|uniref:hypothetical protein n=1 Tax=Microtetraspora malaysiensis TaxID=161358 RepID=UPI003D8AED7B